MAPRVVIVLSFWKINYELGSPTFNFWLQINLDTILSKNIGNASPGGPSDGKFFIIRKLAYQHNGLVHYDQNWNFYFKYQILGY